MGSIPKNNRSRAAPVSSQASSHRLVPEQCAMSAQERIESHHPGAVRAPQPSRSQTHGACCVPPQSHTAFLANRGRRRRPIAMPAERCYRRPCADSATCGAHARVHTCASLARETQSDARQRGGACTAADGPPPAHTPPSDRSRGGSRRARRGGPAASEAPVAILQSAREAWQRRGRCRSPTRLDPGPNRKGGRPRPGRWPGARATSARKRAGAALKAAAPGAQGAARHVGGLQTRSRAQKPQPNSAPRIRLAFDGPHGAIN